MPFTFIPPSTNYFYYPLTIADADGDHSMAFAGIQEPPTAPELTNAKRQVKVGMTRPSASHCGYRVFSSFGASDNLRDLSVKLPLLMPSQLVQLQGYYDGRPGVFSISLGGEAGTPPPIYLVMFKENGLTPENFKYNQRCFTSAKLELYVVGKTTTVTFH